MPLSNLDHPTPQPLTIAPSRVYSHPSLYVYHYHACYQYIILIMWYEMTGLGGDAVTNEGSVSISPLCEGPGAHVAISIRLHTPHHLRVPSPRGQVGFRV